MTTINVELPDETFAAARRAPTEVASEMRVALAIRWYSQSLVSQGMAAQIAGLSRAAFIDALAEARVPVSQESLDDIDETLRRG